MHVVPRKWYLLKILYRQIRLINFYFHSNIKVMGCHCKCNVCGYIPSYTLLDIYPLIPSWIYTFLYPLGYIPSFAIKIRHNNKIILTSFMLWKTFMEVENYSLNKMLNIWPIWTTYKDCPIMGIAIFISALL